MKLKVNRTRVIFFSSKTNLLDFVHRSTYSSHSRILLTAFIKDLGLLSDSILYFTITLNIYFPNNLVDGFNSDCNVQLVFSGQLPAVLRIVHY
jgi:hypothetical protein